MSNHTIWISEMRDVLLKYSKNPSMKYLHQLEKLIENEKQTYIDSLRGNSSNKENDIPNLAQFQKQDTTPRKVSFNESVRVRLFRKDDPASPPSSLGKVTKKCTSPSALKKPLLALREKNVNISSPCSPLAKFQEISSPPIKYAGYSKSQSPKEDDFPVKHQVKIYSSPNHEMNPSSTSSPNHPHKSSKYVASPSASKSPLALVVGASNHSSPTSPPTSPTMFNTLLKRIHDMDTKLYKFNSIDKESSNLSEVNQLDLGCGQIQLFTAFSTSAYKCGLLTLAPHSIKPRCKSRMSEIFFIFNANSLRFNITSSQSFGGNQTIENPPPSSIVIIPNNSTYYIENYGSKTALIGFALLKDTSGY